MRNRLFHTAVVMLVACSFWGCNDDNAGSESDSRIPVVIAGKAYSFDPAVAGEAWKAGKDVGIYMVKENTAECVDPYQNVKYQTTVEPVGYFTPAVKEEVVYCPQDGSKVDVIAYYPWRKELTDNSCPMNVASQATAANFNFLYAVNGKGLNKGNNKKELELRPVLSQIIFKLKAGNGVVNEYLEESVIKVAGMHTKASFNLLTGQFEAASEVKDITLVALEEGNGASGQLFPVTVTDDYVARITLPKMNRDYEWKLAEEIERLKQGMRYICTVTVGLDQIDVVTEEQPVEEWEDGANNSGTGKRNDIGTLIEDLPLGVMKYGTRDPMVMAEGTWFYCSNTVEPDNNVIQVLVERDEALTRHVIHTSFITNANSWFKSFMGYRMKNAQKGVYTLKFKSKGTAGKKVRCYIKSNDMTAGGGPTNVFIANDLKATATPYTGYVEFALGESYQEYALDFNFAKMVKDPYDKPASDLRDATATALADFFVAFYALAVNTEFYLDDISLAEKQ